MKTGKKNRRLCLVLLLVGVILSSPVLSVEASVKGEAENLIIDLSNGIVDNGYFVLPIDKSARELMFSILYYPGYFDMDKNVFTALGVRVFDPRAYSSVNGGVIKVPLKVNLLKLNDVFVFSYRDEYFWDTFYIPVYLGDKEIFIEVIFKEGSSKGEIVAVHEDNTGGNVISLNKGDIIKPIHRYITEAVKTEDAVLEGTNITVDDSMAVTMGEFPAEKYAFRIYAINCVGTENGISDTVAAAQLTADKKLQSEPSSWARAEVNTAVERGLATDRVLRDYQKPITREEFCELIMRLYDRLSGNEEEKHSSNPFKDTDNPEVLRAYNLGIVGGTGNGTFSPNKPLNREQMSAMFFNMIKLLYPDIENTAEELTFNDKNAISKWAYPAIQYMNKTKIITGSNNLFNPQKEASREQATALIARIFEKFNKRMLGLEQ